VHRGDDAPIRARAIVVATAVVLISSALGATTSVAQATCVRTEEDGYSTLSVTVNAVETVSVRFFGSTVDVSDGVNKQATDFVPQQSGLDAQCIMQPDIEQLLINGSDGFDALKIVEWGTSGETPGSDVQTSVDLGPGDDTLEFMTADTNNNGVQDTTPSIFLALGAAEDGTGTVVDQGPTVEGNFLTDCVDNVDGGEINSNGVAFDCSDLLALNVEDLAVTGGTESRGDAVDAQGDFDDGVIDVGTLGVVDDADPHLPGTVDHEGLDSDEGMDGDDNEPNDGDLNQPLRAALNGGGDVIAPGDGSDNIDGGRGRDLVEYAEAGGAIELNLTVGTMSEAFSKDSIRSFSGATGSVFDDRLSGSKKRNLLNGYCGKDVVRGRAGKDLLLGENKVFFRALVCDERSGNADDPGDARPLFSSGDDRIYGGSGGDIIKGRKGNDTLKGQRGKDKLMGGAGPDKGNGGPALDRCRKIKRKKSCER
jgi:Ca2+-binding RTX toxin-like protein